MKDKEFMQGLSQLKKPLTSRFRKKYVESLALGLLQHCYGDAYADFYVYDAPDIQDKDKLTGIEVVEAIGYEEAQIEGEFTKFRLHSSIKDKERSKHIIEHNGAKIEEYGISYPIKYSNDERLIFQNAIRKKMEKLALYKSRGFEKIGLFVFYNEPPIPIKIEELKKCFDDVLDEYRDKFDFMYFGYSCGLIYYDISKDDIQVKTIERNDYDKLKLEARLKVEVTK